MQIQNSFIIFPGIGQKTERKLWKKGIREWSDLENTDKISENRRKKCEKLMPKARKNLEVGNSVFFGEKLPSSEIWRTYRNFEQETCFFDIETTGLDKTKNKVTTVSFHRNGETTTLVRGKDLTRENLKQEMFKSKILVSFNGKRFDQPFLEHNFNLNIQNPHIDLMYCCKNIGLEGGLKKIEKDLNVERELEDIDGREAVKLWKQYEKHGKEDSLQKLVKYNRYDTRNLKDIMEIVHRRLKAKKFNPYLGDA